MHKRYRDGKGFCEVLGSSLERGKILPIKKKGTKGVCIYQEKKSTKDVCQKDEKNTTLTLRKKM